MDANLSIFSRFARPFKMRLLAASSAVCLLCFCPAATGNAAGPFIAKLSPIRAVEGKAVDSKDAAIPGAIIFIKDMNTQKVLQIIADENGAFRYGQLVRAIDYRIWAVYKGKKSREMLLSSYDPNIEMFDVRLRIEDGK